MEGRARGEERGRLMMWPIWTCTAVQQAGDAERSWRSLGQEPCRLETQAGFLCCSFEAELLFLEICLCVKAFGGVGEPAHVVEAVLFTQDLLMKCQSQHLILFVFISVRLQHVMITFFMGSWYMYLTHLNSFFFPFSPSLARLPIWEKSTSLLLLFRCLLTFWVSRVVQYFDWHLDAWAQAQLIYSIIGYHKTLRVRLRSLPSSIPTIPDPLTEGYLFICVVIVWWLIFHNVIPIVLHVGFFHALECDRSLFLSLYTVCFTLKCIAGCDGACLWSHSAEAWGRRVAGNLRPAWARCLSETLSQKKKQKSIVFCTMDIL